MRSLFLTAILISLASAAQGSELCTFTDWAWNSEQGRAENYREVVMPRAQLTPEQRHPSLPCSICREDQAEISVPGAPPALICKAIAKDVEGALTRAAEEGFRIDKITGYRVGRTKGPLDARGLRTRYSHHSFGLAIDVNPESNGLYDRCIEFSPACRLRRGGEWRPGEPAAIKPQSPLYHYMSETGLKWGGELKGRQKDFMHFSITGG